MRTLLSKNLPTCQIERKGGLGSRFSEVTSLMCTLAKEAPEWLNAEGRLHDGSQLKYKCCGVRCWTERQFHFRPALTSCCLMEVKGPIPKTGSILSLSPNENRLTTTQYKPTNEFACIIKKNKKNTLAPLVTPLSVVFAHVRVFWVDVCVCATKRYNATMLTVRLAKARLVLVTLAGGVHGVASTDRAGISLIFFF